jgi:replication factor C subunit 3/5
MELLWTEKYQPTSFEELSFHKDLNQKLLNLSNKGTIPHMIFYGPNGGGKRTRITCLLTKLFGKGVLKTNKDLWKCTLNSNKTVELNIRYSNYHAELSPSVVSMQDRIVIVKFLKESATNMTLFSNANNKKNDYMVFVLYDADKLSLDAQASLRRTLEKYSKKIRVIMVCEKIGGLIPAIKSRCLLIRTKAPSDNEINECLRNIALKERYNSEAFVHDITRASEGNLRKAILFMQSSMITGNIKKEDFKENWKEEIKKIIEKIFTDQSPTAIKSLRASFYELLTNQVPPSNIVKEMLVQFITKIQDEEGKSRAKEIAVMIDTQICQGDKAIIHLESFVVKLMIIVHDSSN